MHNQKTPNTWVENLQSSNGNTKRGGGSGSGRFCIGNKCFLGNYERIPYDRLSQEMVVVKGKNYLVKFQEVTREVKHPQPVRYASISLNGREVENFEYFWDNLNMMGYLFKSSVLVFEKKTKFKGFKEYVTMYLKGEIN